MRKLTIVASVASVLLAALALGQSNAWADPRDHHPHVVVVHRGWPHGYRPIVVDRHRFYRGYPIVRLYGPAYPGFGFYYDDAAAWAFLGFTAWEIGAYNRLNEEQLRAHEDAIVEASTAPVNDPIVWNDGNAAGDVTVVREGHTPDGRECREFQQTISIGGQSEQGFGSACREQDGSWKLVNSHQP